MRSPKQTSCRRATVRGGRERWATLGPAVTSSARAPHQAAEAAWLLWLDECAPAVHLGDDFGREELVEHLATAVDRVASEQVLSYAARVRWWRAWLRVEADRELDLEVESDRARFAAQLAAAVLKAPHKNPTGAWRVFGEKQ